MLYRHRRHVEQNHQHYSDVELLIRRQLEEAQLTFQLQPTSSPAVAEKADRAALSGIAVQEAVIF